LSQLRVKIALAREANQFAENRRVGKATACPPFRRRARW